MKFVDRSGEVVAEAADWAELVYVTENKTVYGSLAVKLRTLASWCAADISRMDDFKIEELVEWVRSGNPDCPFWSTEIEQRYEDDYLFNATSLIWYGVRRSYSKLGRIRAIKKAAREPVKTVKELARLYAEDMDLTIED